MASTGPGSAWAQAQALLQSWDALSSRFEPLMHATLEPPADLLASFSSALPLATSSRSSRFLAPNK